MKQPPVAQQWECPRDPLPLAPASPELQAWLWGTHPALPAPAAPSSLARRWSLSSRFAGLPLAGDGKACCSESSSLLLLRCRPRCEHHWRACFQFAHHVKAAERKFGPMERASTRWMSLTNSNLMSYTQPLHTEIKLALQIHLHSSLLQAL